MFFFSFDSFRLRLLPESIGATSILGPLSFDHLRPSSLHSHYNFTINSKLLDLALSRLKDSFSNAKNKPCSQLPVAHLSQLIRICSFSSCLSLSFLPELLPPAITSSCGSWLCSVRNSAYFSVLIWIAHAQGIELSASPVYSTPVEFG